MAPAGSSSGSGSDSDDDAAGQQVRTVEGVVSGDVAAWLAAGKAWRRSHPSGGGGSSSKYGILLAAVRGNAGLSHTYLAMLALSILATEANCERVFKDAGTVMGAGRGATHSKAARLMAQVPTTPKRGG